MINNLQILDLAVHRASWTLFNVAGSFALQAVTVYTTVAGLSLAQNVRGIKQHDECKQEGVLSSPHFQEVFGPC